MHLKTPQITILLYLECQDQTFKHVHDHAQEIPDKTRTSFHYISLKSRTPNSLTSQILLGLWRIENCRPNYQLFITWPGMPLLSKSKHIGVEWPWIVVYWGCVLSKWASRLRVNEMFSGCLMVYLLKTRGGKLIFSPQNQWYIIHLKHATYKYIGNCQRIGTLCDPTYT